jgi:hypothetical protein
VAERILAAGLAEMQQTELRGGTLLLALLHSPLRYVPPPPPAADKYQPRPATAGFCRLDKGVG